MRSPRATPSRVVAACVILARVCAFDIARADGAIDAPGRREMDDYHYVFSADCQPYMTWQARALYDSWRAIGSPGRITRLLSCTEAQYETYAHLDVVPDTVKCPDFVWYAKEKYGDADGYAAYNLPGGMNHWAQNVGTDRKWVVKLDADMLLLKPLTVEEIPAKRGTAASGEYDYLVGTRNGMAKWFLNEEEERLIAPVGGWEIFDAKDFMALTPYWLEYTAKVRMDRRVWWPYRGTGDEYITERGPRPWISEMYGFVFGCAKAGIRHNVMSSIQLYAGYTPWDTQTEDPYIIHYGLKMTEGEYDWDKHYDEGHLERMTCDTMDAKPFPVVKLPQAPNEGASRDEVRRYIKVKIMYKTVSSINDAVQRYNFERCSGRAEAPQKVVRRSLPETQAPRTVEPRPVVQAPNQLETKTRREIATERQREEQVQAEAERKIRELDNKLYREEQMEKFWNFVTILGLCYVLMRLCNAGNRKRDARRRAEKNPFRTVKAS